MKLIVVALVAILFSSLVPFAQTPLRSISGEELRMKNIALQLSDAYRTLHEHNATN